MARKKKIHKKSSVKEQIGLAMKVLDSPFRRAEFLFNPSAYAKKENVQLDSKWVKVIEQEVSKINRRILEIEDKFYSKQR